MRRSKGSIVEKVKGKQYEVQVSLGTDPITGKRKRISKTVRGSKRKAEETLAAMLVQYGNEPTEEMTLDAFWFGIYLPRCKKRLREDTWRGYQNKYDCHLKEKFGNVKLCDLSPALVEGLIDTIDGDKRRFEAYKILRQILNRAVRLNLIPSNPCSNVEPPRKDRYRPETLKAEYLSHYFDAFNGSDIEAAFLIAIGGGLRRSEICALNWEDISQDGAVTIDDAIVITAGKVIHGKTKTEFSRRTVHMPKKITERLNEIRSDGALLKCNGYRMSPDLLYRKYQRILKSLPDEVPRITMKNLRHTSLTLAIEAGADLLSVSRRGGHSSTYITSQYYLRPGASVDIKAAERLNSLL